MEMKVGDYFTRPSFSLRITDKKRFVSWKRERGDLFKQVPLPLEIKDSRIGMGWREFVNSLVGDREA